MMSRFMRGALRLVSPFAFVLLPACSDEPATTPPTETDIFDRLQAIPGMVVTEENSGVEGYRYFVMEYEQPADHGAEGGPVFRQRLLLHHRDEAAPFVLGTSGYNVNPTRQRLREPASFLQANQLFVEQRFFTPSRPEPADWSLLTIEQAAADHHRIVEVLKPIYTGKWISSGASKGGMTSVYHRRFFPDDVDGTVAYVAPHSFGTKDARYLDFVASLGSSTCQDALQYFQREVLLRRPAMLARIDEQATMVGLTYDLLGREKALEVATLELVFTFWQYYDESVCPEVGAEPPTDDDVWTFLDEIASPSLWSDEEFLTYEPYYWQAATELGFPAVEESHVADLLQFPGIDTAETFLTPGKTPVFDASAMQDISTWISAEGERLLFVYGETDPYTAAAFELGNAKDSYRFLAPGLNHSALIVDLVEPDRAKALDALEAWTGVTPVLPPETAIRARRTRRDPD
ncbi:S28 family serine protease [Polyangium mundeleinium]|uniref:S28 family serine protease n=1 Tax=Polyangium mundeleinium TaxID=2995306 RepID=A0ABT5F0Z3_9BACT|nr:S28 family serine protease [Polyangium mundeleinium]MDC0747756.1 S28 family serine protease [Polyangium mundeleinium]